MSVKTREDIVVESNGKLEHPSAKRLSKFQEKYMKRLITNFEKAKASVDAAQNAANEFIVACGEEMGIQVGNDGWTFDVDSLEFVCVPQGENNGEG